LELGFLQLLSNQNLCLLYAVKQCIFPLQFHAEFLNNGNSAHPGWVKTDKGGQSATGQSATMELSEGGRTSAALATLTDDGPTGGLRPLG
jgi:hypothetical protein